MTPRWARRKRVQEVKGARDRNMGRPATVHTTLSMDTSRLDDALRRHIYYAVPPSTWPEYPFLSELMEDWHEERRKEREGAEAAAQAAQEALADVQLPHPISLNTETNWPARADASMFRRNP